MPADALSYGCSSPSGRFGNSVLERSHHPVHQISLARKVFAASQAEGFDLFLDGRLVARNVSVPGLSGRLFRVGVSTQTDREGNSYTVSVDRLHLYRRAPR